MKKILQMTFIFCVAMLSHEVTAQVFQQDMTTKGNVELRITNYGNYGVDTTTKSGGGVWPRGSENQYIFGGGIWFVGLKLKDGDIEPRKIASISLNPNTGKSWTSPGRTEDGPAINTTTPNKYKIQTSQNYNNNGTPKNPSDPKWSVWNTKGALKENANFGSSIYTESKRSSVYYPQGAAFVSDEDMITVFKDTDLSRYEDSVITRLQKAGYPLGIQYEQSVYSWDMGTPLQDVIVIRYTAINTSQDILRECYLAPVIDADIALKSNATNGATNDRTKFFSERPELQTAVQWTNGNQKESGKGFGYLGLTLLESPAVNEKREIRKDKPYYTEDEQIGVHTFRNWTIANDPFSDDERYNFASTGSKDGDDGPGDKRMLMSTGSFNMYPGDTARVAIALTFANSSTTGPVATGVIESFGELIDKILLIRKELYPGIFSSVKTENLLNEQPAFISFKNDEATLHFKNNSFKNLRAELFNTLGERVSMIHNGDISTSEISFKTNGLPAGMYYCVITSGSERMTVPMTIMR